MPAVHLPAIGILNFDRAGGSRLIAKAAVSALQRRGRIARVMTWGHGLPLDPAVHDCAGVIAFAYDEAESAHHLASLRVPIVNTAYPIPGIPRVVVDDHATGALAADEFLGLGIRRCAFFGTAGLDFSDRKQAGFEERLRRDRIEPEVFTDLWRLKLTSGQAVYEEKILTWLRSLPRPCGILTPLDDNAAHLVQLCQQGGLRIPEDLAIMGSSGDDDACEAVQPPLTTVIHPFAGVAETAVGLLEELLAGGKPPAGPILLPPSGIARRRSTDLLLVDDAIVARAMAIIAARSAEGLVVEDLLSELPVGRRDLERRFRRTLGRSPLAEIMRVRVERAKRLLSDHDRTLEDISRRSGFGSARRLTEAFRRMVGTDPLTWRRGQHR